MTEELPYYLPMAFVFSNVPQHSQANYEIARFFQEAQEKIVWLEKEQEDARSDIKVIFYFPTPNPLPNFLLPLNALVQISFSSQPSAAMKTKDGGHNFR